MAKKELIRPVKGTRDFYPEEMARRNWLYANMRAASQSFGYQEWEAPILETLELYAAKSGEELVKEQAFVFNDRGGDQITLRPELTPSLARLVAQKAQHLPRPIRWWSFGPFWRYERPQKGRTREFFQWNVDLLGTPAIAADAEIAAIAATFFHNIGLQSNQVYVQVNSRRLMDAKLTEIGISDKRAALALIDRIDKLPTDKWRAYGSDRGLTDPQLDALAALLQRDDLWHESDELTAFFTALDAMALRHWFAYDPKVVRGLDYYTGVVMEGRDRDGNFRAIFGGGRYDNLVADVGSNEQITGVGFGMGDVVVGLVAEAFGLIPAFQPSPAVVLVTLFDTTLTPASLRLAADLRSAGFNVEVYPDTDKLGRQLKYADAQRIPIAAILGADEAAAGQVTLKHLASGQQVQVAQAAAAEQIRALLAAGTE